MDGPLTPFASQIQAHFHIMAHKSPQFWKVFLNRSDYEFAHNLVALGIQVQPVTQEVFPMRKLLEFLGADLV